MSCNGADLMEYFEIVNEARPLSGFPAEANFCYRNNFHHHETKKYSKFQSDPIELDV